MGGAIADLPVRVCPACGAVWIEDGNMYEDTDICPACGVDAASAAGRESEKDEVFE